MMNLMAMEKNMFPWFCLQDLLLIFNINAEDEKSIPKLFFLVDKL